MRLSPEDVQLVARALATLRPAAPRDAERAEQLLERLRFSNKAPAITVGVYGGLVQWVKGNPFPIRIIDYDGEDDELPDRDEDDLACSIWHEPADPDLSAAQA